MTELPVIRMHTTPYKDAVILTETQIEMVETMAVRPDDIWVVSFPKSGTTLVQEIVYLIATNLDFKTAAERQMDDRFPFLDVYQPALPYYRGVRYIEGLPSPRFIKSHLQYHVLPPTIHTVKPKIVYVARNPKDAFVSFYYFLKYLCELDDGVSLATFVKFCTDDVPLGSPWWKHVLEFWTHRHEDNILFLKFEDIIQDLPGTVRQIAAFLEKDVTEDGVARIADHCSFHNMKDNKMVNLTYMEKYRQTDPDQGHLVRKGTSGGWRDHESLDMDVIDDIIHEKLEPFGLTF